MSVTIVYLLISTFCLGHFCQSAIYDRSIENEVIANKLLTKPDVKVEPKRDLPIVINTWNITKATAGAWKALTHDELSAVDALVEGCGLCEDGSCLPSIGMGGSPDENGETTLDAMIMDGKTMDVGSVGCLRFVENAIKVAHAVMKYSKHTLLVGSLATDFAVSMGFEKQSLQSNTSYEQWLNWTDNNCQPNFWQNVRPDPSSSCGPYSPDSTQYKDYVNHIRNTGKSDRYNENVDEKHHDTIGMVVIDGEGNVASGTTTNGASHKIPGRVGDSPIAGAGSYAMNDVGGAAATGDGDVMMRFLPSFYAVQQMSKGEDPTTAARSALELIKRFYPDTSAALVTVNVEGDHGAACMGMETFCYNVIRHSMEEIDTITISCDH